MVIILTDLVYLLWELKPWVAASFAIVVVFPTPVGPTRITTLDLLKSSTLFMLILSPIHSDTLSFTKLIFSSSSIVRLRFNLSEIACIYENENSFSDRIFSILYL